jgi:putative phosphoribosyl transferase
VVLALPRGGVPVALEVAQALSAPLDLILVRKIGHPLQPELALGAIVDGEHPEFVLNEDVAALTGDAGNYLETAKATALAEIERRRKIYLGGRRQAEVRGCSAIVVDDGIATGATVRAALKALRHKHPKRIVLAVPVAPTETIESLRRDVDEIVCLQTPDPFYAIGAFYKDFRPVEDAEVIRLLRAADSPAPRSA